MENYKALVKEFLAESTGLLRKDRNLTQEQLSERLHISSRSYGDLERGKYCFSAPALLSLLAMLKDEEVKEFLDKFRQKIGAAESSESASSNSPSR